MLGFSASARIVFAQFLGWQLFFVAGRRTVSKPSKQVPFDGPEFDSHGRRPVMNSILSVMDTLEPMPRRIGDEDVIVRFAFHIHKVMNIDVKNGVLPVSGDFKMLWNDERLLFNGSDVGEGWEVGRHWLTMPPEKLWTPDVEPYYSNQVEGTAFKPTPVFIYDEAFLRANGYNAFWSRPALLNPHCDINLLDFPFDIQECTLVFGSRSNTAAIFRLIAHPHISGTEVYSSEEWDITVYDATNSSNEYMTGTYEEVHIRIVMRRFYGHYLVNLVMPLLLMMSLSGMTTWIPISCGERVGFAGTLLLTIMATTFFSTDAKLPIGKDSWISKFHGICQFLAVLPLAESCFMVWLIDLVEKVATAEHIHEPLHVARGRTSMLSESSDLMRQDTTRSAIHTLKPGRVSYFLVRRALRCGHGGIQRWKLKDLDTAFNCFYNLLMLSCMCYIASLVPGHVVAGSSSETFTWQLVPVLIIFSVLILGTIGSLLLYLYAFCPRSMRKADQEDPWSTSKSQEHEEGDGTISAEVGTSNTCDGTLSSRTTTTVRCSGIRSSSDHFESKSGIDTFPDPDGERATGQVFV